LFGHSKHQTQYVAKREPGNVEMFLHKGREYHFLLSVLRFGIFLYSE